MGSRNKSVFRNHSTSGKLVSAFLVFAFALSGFSINSEAAADKKTAKGQRRQNLRVELKMAEFEAEKFGEAVRIVWRSGFEENILGFRVWREQAGQKTLVNRDLIAGSALKLRNAVLPAGHEYVYYDLERSDNAFYRLEAIDLNSESRWFGPIFPNVGIADDEIRNEMREWLASISPNESTQTENVVFDDSKAAKTVTANLENTANEFLPGDQTALKMEIRRRGLHRIDGQSLAERGFDSTQGANLKLFVGGIEQAINVNPDGSVEFFGDGLDTLQTDANVYWLTSNTTGGRRINRTTQSYLASAPDGWGFVTAEKRERTMRLSSVLNGARENWFGSYVSNALISKTLNLRDIATESNRTATLAVHLQGIASGVHQVAVKLNGTAVGQISFNHFERKEWSVSIPLSGLLEGENTITLQSLNGSSDYSVTETLKITYPQRLKAFENRLEFSPNGTQAFKIKGFTTPQVRVFDVTDAAQVAEITPESRLETDGTYSITLAGSATPRRLLAQSAESQSFAVNPLIPNRASDLRNAQNGGRFLIIAPLEYFKVMNDLANYRTQEGMLTKIVDVEDIYDEFSNGVKSAEAIKAFLQYAKQNWTVKPDFVMLAGDASSDPRNYSGMGGDAVNRVPTMFTDTWNMEAATDEMLVDFNGDSIGEIVVGRLPAQTRDELELMIEKNNNHQALSPAEVGGRGVHFVSDDYLGYDFAAASRNIASTIPAGVAVNYIDRTPQQDTATLRGNIINGVTSGASLVNYFGHGSVTSWTSAGILRNVDAQGMFNQKKPTFFVSLACLNGDYTVFGTTSLAEALMKRSNGGAFAVWAASGWNAAYEEELMGRDLYQRVFSGMRLGEAVREVKSLYPTVDMRRTFIFFGDPTQRLIRF